MKTKHSFLILSAVLATSLSFVACDEKANLDLPGSNAHNQDSIYVAPDPDPTPDPTDVAWLKVPANAINAREARHISDSIGSGKTSTQSYYIKGWVTKLYSSYASDIAAGKGATFYIAACNAGNDNKTFEIYHAKGKNNIAATDPNIVAVGDFVVVYAQITNYNGTQETSGGYIYSSTNALFKPIDPTPDPEGAVVPEGAIDVRRALAIADSIGLGHSTAETYLVKGYVKSVESLTTTGMMTFKMAASTDASDMDVFIGSKVLNENKSKFASTDNLKQGDFVVLSCRIQNSANGIQTFGTGNAYVTYYYGAQ